MFHYITWFEIASLAAAIVALPVLWKQSPMRILFVLLLLIVGVELYQTIQFRINPGQNNSSLYNFFAPLQWLLYGVMLHRILQSRTNRKALGVLIAIFLAITLISLPGYLRTQQYNVISHAAGTLMIVSGVFLAFYEMLKSPISLNFLKHPYFYLLFFLLFFMVGTAPYFVMGNWVYFNMGRPDLAMVLNNVMSILNYLLYTVYTICFVWMRVTKVSF
ncbi:MAG: hypothetical protein AAFQ98_19395 [Bacteroidota bacterium]